MPRTIFFAAFVAAFAMAVAPAFAGGHSSSSISLVTASGAAPTASVSFGSSVTFNVSTTATSFPWVEVDCTQGKTLVYAQTQSFANGAAPMYQVGPTPSWSGGAASCTATLFSYDNARRHDLASTSFNVG